MIRPADKERGAANARALGAAASEWAAIADYTEGETGQKVSVAAAWTRDGVLIVLARGERGRAIAGELERARLAEPQFPERAGAE